MGSPQTEAEQVALDMKAPVVSASALEAGDVLLFRSRPFMSRLIRKLDSASVNHVALAADATTIIQASPGGVATVPLSDAMKNVEYALVRRCQGQRCQNRRQVAECARSMIAQPYSYETVFLLGLHIALGENLPVGIRRFLSRLVAAATAFVRRTKKDHRQPLFCSELIWLAFHNSGATLNIPESFHAPNAALADAFEFGWKNPAVVQAGEAVTSDQEEALAAAAFNVWESSGPTSSAPPIKDALGENLYWFGKEVLAYKPMTTRRLPRLGDNLLGLVSYVGQATTPQDIYREWDRLGTVGRLVGPG